MTTHWRGYSVGGKGVSNAICDVCRGKFKNYELKSRWDGLMVCDEDWEPRHILDFYRPPRDNFPLPFVRKDTPDIGSVNAVLSATISSPTLGSWTLLPFNTELADTGNQFNTGTSAFQPSSSGTYLVTAAAKYTWPTTGGRGYLALYKNGSPYKVSPFVETPGPGTEYIQVNQVMDLLNTDVVTVRYNLTGSSASIIAADEATFINVVRKA